MILIFKSIHEVYVSKISIDQTPSDTLKFMLDFEKKSIDLVQEPYGTL